MSSCAYCDVLPTSTKAGNFYNTHINISFSRKILRYGYFLVSRLFVILKNKKVQLFRPFNMGPTGSPETSVLNQRTPSNNPEDGIIHFNRGGSLRSQVVRKLSLSTS
jgi:hypothetical protein